MRFSQRIGKVPVRSVVQTDGIDEPLLNGLWNCLHESYWSEMIKRGHIHPNSEDEYIVQSIWRDFYKERLDAIPFGSQNVLNVIRQRFYDWNWLIVYDFVEFVASIDSMNLRQARFRSACNAILVREMSGFRFVGTQIAPITDEMEITAVEQAAANTSDWNVVSVHIARALALLSDRKNPDYRNSIKESISAVESAACIVTGGKSTLGEALKILEKKHGLHPALKESFSKLYGYTNDGDGIRHALLEETNLDQADARFMLIACSAFVNYLKSKVG
jgi:hypothetical protein